MLCCLLSYSIPSVSLFTKTTLQVIRMIMATSPDPCLCSTSVVEDTRNHDEVIGLKLSYALSNCFFTVLLSAETPQVLHQSPSQTSSSNGLAIGNLLARFNEACTWTDQDKTIDDVDKRLEVIWQEAEDLVRAAAFKKIVCLAHQHGTEPISELETRQGLYNLSKYLFPKSFNLQITSDRRGFIPIMRPDLPPTLPFTFERDIPPNDELISIKPENVQILQRCRSHILKVRVGQSIFCCKLNNTGSQNSFLREFEILQRIQRLQEGEQIYVPKLRGMVQVEGGTIGLLMDWVEAEDPDLMVVLRTQKEAKVCDRQKWAEQISKSLKRLHGLGLIWGDAKTSNILIDKHRNAWLIDFGGGFTRDWVDETLYDTQAGDLQGLGNILLDIFGKR